MEFSTNIVLLARDRKRGRLTDREIEISFRSETWPGLEPGPCEKKERKTDRQTD